MKPGLKNFTVRMQPELIRRIKLAAFTDGLSMQEWTRQLITGILDFNDKSEKFCRDSTDGKLLK